MRTLPTLFIDSLPLTHMLLLLCFVHFSPYSPHDQAGVWTESLGLAAETATAVRAGVVWVNGHNKFDAAAGFGGYKESGHGREGGREGLYAYVQPKWRVGEAALGDVSDAILARAASGAWGRSDPTLPAPPQPQEQGGKAGKAGKAGAKKVGSAPAFAASPGLPQIDRTPKLYVGGKQQRPDHEHSLTVHAAKVSAGRLLLVPVITFHANPAHNLTRSPSHVLYRYIM